MKKIVTAVSLLVVTTLFVCNINTNSSDNSGSRSSRQIDSLITAYGYTFEQWNVQPYQRIQWTNGETISEWYVVAKFVNPEGGLPADKTRLTAFSEELVALIEADLSDKNAFTSINVAFEESNGFILFKSSQSWSLKFLLHEPEAVAQNRQP